MARDECGSCAHPRVSHRDLERAGAPDKPAPTLPQLAGRVATAALIVGTVLNLINQGDAIFGTTSVNVNRLKLAVTYGVPYVLCTCCGVSFALETGSPPGGTTQARRPSGT